jgi:hypothetical protein
MSTSLLVTRAAAVVALLALGCAKRDPDPTHFKIADFRSGKELTDTLKSRIPNGMRETAVWEIMQGNGFSCGERGVDQRTGTSTIGIGKSELHCSGSTRINFGLRRREWWVFFQLDSGRVTDINTLSFKQDL